MHMYILMHMYTHTLIYMHMHIFVNAETNVNMSIEQRPEDFMDDEDLGEFGFAPRQLIAAGEFSVSKRCAVPDLIYIYIYIYILVYVCVCVLKCLNKSLYIIYVCS